MKQLFTLLVLATFAFTSCNEGVLYKEFQKTADLEWAKSDVKSFTFNNTDDTSAYDIFFAFRYAQGFQFKEASVLIMEGTPTVKNEIPLKFKTVNDQNEYLGDGSGDIWDLEIPFKEKVKLEKGVYTYTIGHTFPLEVVNMVMEVGIIVKKSENQ